MNLICGCEESQVVAMAFRAKGWNAFSCDVQECSGGFPQYHLKMDVLKAIKGGRLKTQGGNYVNIDEWNMGIFFPDCTFITVSGNKWFKNQPQPESGVLVGAARRKAQQEAVEFAKILFNSPIKRVALENPVGRLSTLWKPPTQIVQPWWFGHGEVKKTCLWLRNLPKLNATDIVEGREERIFRMGPSEDRAKERSKTFPGLAQAMSQQWSHFNS